MKNEENCENKITLLFGRADYNRRVTKILKSLFCRTFPVIYKTAKYAAILLSKTYLETKNFVHAFVLLRAKKIAGEKAQAPSKTCVVQKKLNTEE